MKKRIGVISDNQIVYNKIRLLLRDECDVELISESSDPSEYILVFADINTARRPSYECITLGDGGDIPLPFRHEDILSAVMDASDDPDRNIKLLNDGRNVHLLGETVKLTEVEYRLLERLLSADGFVSKDELLHSVWGDGFDAGVVNVYVCYLRRKLEKSGTKIIISSRNEGYKIDEKYRRRI